MWQRSGFFLVMLFSLYSTSLSLSRGAADAVKDQNVFKPLESLMQSTQWDVMMGSRNMNATDSPELIKPRVKRQKPGANDQQKEFSDVAKIDAVKAFQIYLTALKRLWKASALGGGEPLTPNVPKPVIFDFKEKVMNYFIPAKIPLPGYPRGMLYP